MQNVTVYLQLEGIKGERIDAEGNLLRSRQPEITRGISSRLELKLRDGTGKPWENLELYDSWEFYAGDDWNASTTVLLAVTDGISAAGESVLIPLNNVNTAELAAALGEREKISLHAELLGFCANEDAPVLVVQFEITVRNRVALSGTELPAELPPVYLTAGAVKALVAAETRSAMPRINEENFWEINGESSGIPATGPKGERGEAFSFDETGTLEERALYDTAAKGFAFLATDNGSAYIKASDAPGDWSEPIPFKGDKGDPGEKGEKGDKGDRGEQGESGILENFKLTVTSLADGGIAIENETSFPVALLTSKGNCYPLEKESCAKAETGWRIDIARYLAYDNVSAFQPPWYVYCAGGIKGEPGTCFSPDARGVKSGISNYGDRPAGFAFLAMDEGCIYFKLSSASDDWSEGVFFRGEKGEQGMPGAKGDKGDKGDRGDTGTLLVTVSSTEPANPVEGMLWIKG